MNRQQTIHDTFSVQAAQSRERLALVSGEESLTYGDLDARSDRIAAYLMHHGIHRGDRVGLFAQRSVAAVATLLGILKAGAAYVPFDPSYPAKLLRFMYDDCAPKLMLADPSLLDPEGSPWWPGAVHDVRTAAAHAAALTGAGSALPITSAEDLAYVMYTSGSTGHPKGVLIPHRGVVRLVIDNTFADLGPSQVHLQLAPLAFDASTFEIWGALLNGGKLAVVTSQHPSLDDVADAIARYRVTTLWLTAGLFHLMVDHRLEALAPLRQLIAGGDVLSPSHVARAQAGLPHCQIINGYGPTENTTFTCCYRIPRGPGAGAPGVGQPIPIGTPIARTTVYIVDDAGAAVADGEPGELVTGGDGLALGYLNREELTAERFVANPFDAGGGARLYKTGDRVRKRPDGNIEFLGRVDRQVKINGKRVELDEIEALLRTVPRIEDAAVTASRSDNGVHKVHAYVKFVKDETGVRAAGGSIALVRDHLREEAPDHMMPATFTVLDELPLSPTGKVDRAKLPPPNPAAAAAAHSTAPAAPSGTRDALRRIWCEVLGLNDLGLDDNFFDLGGTSLQLVEVHATIARIMNSDLTLVELFQYPRISALAARIEARTGAGPAPAPPHAAAAPLNAADRALRQKAALARARAGVRRS
jgi:amino acid adenylation domain-containing protein